MRAAARPIGAPAPPHYWQMYFGSNSRPRIYCGMSASHSRDYHLLLDEHGYELLAMKDPLAKRIGGDALRSGYLLQAMHRCS
ncbi:hypothetical protein ACIQUB_17485 [Rhizobium sp. NPDC090275]|uniref:hypothetical protein n=1 Tax=Rhizobium sp. NPDC090275 TaxID=3364498 RepID=UPI00383BE9A7